MTDYRNGPDGYNRTRSPWGWIGAIVAIVLVVGVIWWAAGGRHDDTTAANGGTTTTAPSTAQAPADRTR